jgi:acyl dehydratase
MAQTNMNGSEPVVIASDQTVIPISDNSGSLTVDGTVTVTQGTGSNLHAVVDSGTITSITNVVHTDDNAGSLTVDNPTLSVTGNGTSSTALRVTVSSDSTGVIAVTDNAASLTIDNPILSVTGNGTNVGAQRVTLASDSTGSVVATQATGTNLHTVVDSGTISTITNVVHIDDNAASLTVDNPALAVTGNGTNTGAQRVTIASDSTGTLAVTGTVAATQSGAWNITNVSGTVSLPTGASTDSTLGTMSAKLPASLGQKAMAASMSIVVASDQAAIPVSLSTPSQATYSAVALGIVPAASATDVFTITGSASKTISITAISIDGLATTSGAMKMQLMKRSSANTGGTSTAVTAVPFDSNDAAASATVLAYTSNPIVGTPVGTLETFIQAFPSTAQTYSDDGNDFTYGTIGKPIVLRGVAQTLAINLNGASAPAGGTLDIKMTWTEA